MIEELAVVIKARDEASQVFDEVWKKIGKLADPANLAKVAIAGVGTAVVALGAALAASVYVAADFEQQMANVKAISGASGEEFKKLEKLAKDMGATTQFSASEAADAITFLAQSGMSANDIMVALPTTLNLAAAGATSLGAAANIATSIMAGMGLSATELTHVADALAQAARGSNADIGGLGESFRYVGSLASAAGLTFDETTAALGLLANAGLKASTGGTSLSGALREMLNPSEKAQQVMAALGLTFTDSHGRIRPLVDIVGELESANVTAKDAIVMFGDEGGRAINALVGQGTEKLAALQESLKASGGVAEDMAKTQMATFRGSVDELKSALEGVAISVGQTVLPALTSFVNEGLAPAAQKANEWAEAIKKQVDLAFQSQITFVTAEEQAALRAARGYDEYQKALDEMYRKRGEALEQNKSYLDGLGKQELGADAVTESMARLWMKVDAAKGSLAATNEVLGGKTGTIEFFTALNQRVDELTKKDLKAFSDKSKTAIDEVGQAAKKLHDEVMASLGPMSTEIVDEFGQVKIKIGEELEKIEYPETELGFDDVVVLKPDFSKTVATRFQYAFEEGLGRLIRTGSFTEFLSSVGTSLLDSIIGGVTKNLAKKFSDAIMGEDIGKIFSGLGFSWGTSAGNSIVTGINESASSLESASNTATSGSNAGNIFGASFATAAVATVQLLFIPKVLAGLSEGISELAQGNLLSAGDVVRAQYPDTFEDMLKETLGSLRFLLEQSEKAGMTETVKELHTQLAGTENLPSHTTLKSALMQVGRTPSPTQERGPIFTPEEIAAANSGRDAAAAADNIKRMAETPEFKTLNEYTGIDRVQAQWIVNPTGLLTGSPIQAITDLDRVQAQQAVSTRQNMMGAMPADADASTLTYHESGIIFVIGKDTEGLSAYGRNVLPIYAWNQQRGEWDKVFTPDHINVVMARESKQWAASIGKGETPSAIPTLQDIIPPEPEKPNPVAPPGTVFPALPAITQTYFELRAGLSYEQTAVADHMKYVLGRSNAEIGATINWMQSASGSVTMGDIFREAGGDPSAGVAQVGKHVENYGILGWQYGGSFMVPGAGPPDSQLVAFRASPGERVDITPPGSGFVGGARSGNQIVNVFNVSLQSPDVEGMRRLIDGEFGDLVIERIFRESRGGWSVIQDTGISSPPVS